MENQKQIFENTGGPEASDVDVIFQDGIDLNDLISFEPESDDDCMGKETDLDAIISFEPDSDDGNKVNSFGEEDGIDLNDLISFEPESDDDGMGKETDLDAIISYEQDSDDGNKANSFGEASDYNVCDDDTYKGRPKRGRKRKVPNQSRSDRKRLLNTNKTHTNTRGNIHNEKMFDEEYECCCLLNCTNLVHVKERRRLFTQFWSIGTFEGRAALLNTCVTEKNKKRTYTKAHIKNRTKTRKYRIFGTRVCKEAFLGTLQISDSRITTALRKANSDKYTDLRGKASGGANAFPLSKRAEVCAHISSFPKYVSHYTRAQTESKFLNADLNLSKMYRLYKTEVDKPVSETFYGHIFRTKFNLRFKKPKKDTCHKCDVFAATTKNSTGAALAASVESHNIHLEQAELLQKQMMADLEAATYDDELEVLTFDMQKILSLPKVPTSVAYYKRQLNLYNFGVHVGSTGNCEFNLWTELIASKGTQEVGSCLVKHVSSITRPIKKLILWSDSCGGQNRSIKLILMLMYLLQNHKTLESISMRYLLSGHSFLPNDTEFGDAECALKQHERIFTTDKYMEIMQDCHTTKKITVNQVSPDSFFSVRKLESMITNRKKDLNNQKISWLDTHEILLTKSEPSIIKMRKKIGGVFQPLNVGKNGLKLDFRNFSLDKLWPEGRPLSNEKLKDLKDMLNLVPEDEKHFYEFLNHVQSADFPDDVDGFGQSIDFEAEYCE